MAKPFLTYDEQIDKLVGEKQLQITDIEYAKAVLKNIGYFSLIGGYKMPFINDGLPFQLESHNEIPYIIPQFKPPLPQSSHP